MLASLAKVNVITTLYGEKMLCDLHLFAVDTPPKISNLGSSLDLNSSFLRSFSYLRKNIDHMRFWGYGVFEYFGLGAFIYV